MAKKKSGVITFPRPAAAPAHQEIERAIVDEPVVVVEAVYAFPTKSRCPKCRRLATRATSTRGDVQLRKCIRPSCRTTYKEAGTAI